MIHLHQLPKTEGAEYSYSPFCLKLELYLKIMGLDYQNEYSLESNKSPTGKMPYIELNGKKFADSNLIIKHLEKDSGKFIDKHLTQEQKAISTAFMRLCEDSLYWGLSYGRWIDNKSWKKTFIQSSGLPNIMANIVYPTAKRNMSRQLGIQFSTLSGSEMYSKVQDDIQAIANFLNTRKYFFNNELSLVDIAVFSFLVMIRNGSCGQKMSYLLSDYDFEEFMANMIDNFSKFSC